MIVSVRHKGLRRFWEKGDSSGLPYDQIKKIRFILNLLHTAKFASDMNFSGLNLHMLNGDLDNFWAVTVKANWRIIFKFADGRVYLVDYLDYH